MSIELVRAIAALGSGAGLVVALCFLAVKLYRLFIEALDKKYERLSTDEKHLSDLRTEMINRQDAKIKELEARMEAASAACEKQMEKLRRRCEEDTAQLQHKINVLSRIVNRLSEDDRLDDSPAVG